MAESGAVGSFRIILVMMLFYSFCITVLVYALPSDAATQVLPYSNVGDNIDMEGISQDLEEGLTRQTNIPVIEAGALVFYSGNILIDLLLNFAYALPQMLGLLVHGITYLFNLDAFIFVSVQIFASVLMTALYFLGLIQLLTGQRSGSGLI